MGAVLSVRCQTHIQTSGQVIDRPASMAIGAVQEAVTDKYLSAQPKDDYPKITEAHHPQSKLSGFQGPLSGRQFEPSYVRSVSTGAGGVEKVRTPWSLTPEDTKRPCNN